MIDIDKIPGFEKTPDTVITLIECDIILKIAKIKNLHIDNILNICRKIKKLLDNQRGLLKLIIVYESFVCNPKSHLKGIDRNYLNSKLKKITGKTWEELND